MNYNEALLIFIAGLGIVFFAFLFLNGLYKKSIYEKIKKLPFPEQYKEIVAKTPHYSKLSTDDQSKLQRTILYFMHSKEFIGVDLEVTDEMRVLIAFYACLLLVHKNTRKCYDELKTIIIYPHSVIIKQVQSRGGVYSDEQFVIQGQSANHTVVITWNEAKKESYHMRHNNLIIHEFAHEIDFMDGEIDGIPPIENSKYDGWAKILHKEFNALNAVANKNRNWGKHKLLGAYAASNEAEFFAVVTERFFETPASLKLHFPELYDEFKDFYQIDTAQLFS